MTGLQISEAEWQQQVIDLAHAHGWMCAHFRPARTSKGWVTPVAADGQGFPDLVLTRERVMFVELKSQRGRLSEQQRLWIVSLRAAGAEVHVWKPDHFDHAHQTLKDRIDA